MTNAGQKKAFLGQASLYLENRAHPGNMQDTNGEKTRARDDATHMPSKNGEIRAEKKGAHLFNVHPCENRTHLFIPVRIGHTSGAL